MMTLEYYNWAKSQPGFQGWKPAMGGAGVEPIWASGYGPGTPSYKEYVTPNKETPKTEPRPDPTSSNRLAQAFQEAGRLPPGIRPSYAQQMAQQGNWAQRWAQDQAARQQQAQEMMKAMSAQSPQRGGTTMPAYGNQGAFNQNSGFNFNPFAGSQFGGAMTPGRQQMASMMSAMSGQSSAPQRTIYQGPKPWVSGGVPTPYGGGSGFLRALSSGQYQAPSGQVYGGMGDYFRANAPAPTTNSDPISWGFQGGSNPLQAFTSASGFGQPMGGWSGGSNPMSGSRGTSNPYGGSYSGYAGTPSGGTNPMMGGSGMPKDNPTAKQWYQQNPNKEWWQSA